MHNVDTAMKLNLMSTSLKPVQFCHSFPVRIKPWITHSNYLHVKCSEPKVYSQFWEEAVLKPYICFVNDY